MSCALMAALSLLELSWRLLPQGRWRGLRSWWRGGASAADDISSAAEGPSGDGAPATAPVGGVCASGYAPYIKKNQMFHEGSPGAP